jgi:hypothetical protein
MHYAAYLDKRSGEEIYGTAELVCGSGYLFREDGQRTATLVSYRDPELLLLGLVEVADGQYEVDRLVGRAAIVCGRESEVREMNASTDRQQFRSILADLAAKTQAKLPALNGRVTKACKLVLAGDVALHPDGTALVNSLTDPTRAYQVTGSPATCQCQDYDRAPEHLCCHRLAVGFTRKVQALLPTPQSTGVETGAPVAALPEAPCSVNCHLTVAGRQVQLTLRGTDEVQVLARLEEVLQRYPVPQAASPASTLPPVDAPPQCPQHGALKKSSKGKGWYCPTRLDDDTWCPSKGR